MSKFIIKHIYTNKPQKKTVNKINEAIESKIEITEKKETVMTTSEKIAMAQEVLNNNSQEGNIKTKRIKRDKGLIERTESSKTILTEDNKELLKD